MLGCVAMEKALELKPAKTHQAKPVAIKLKKVNTAKSHWSNHCNIDIEIPTFARKSRMKITPVKFTSLWQRNGQKKTRLSIMSFGRNMIYSAWFRVVPNVF